MKLWYARSDARDRAIGAALVLALVVGLLQTGFFLLSAPGMISAMGAGAGSPMRRKGHESNARHQFSTSEQLEAAQTA